MVPQRPPKSEARRRRTSSVASTRSRASSKVGVIEDDVDIINRKLERCLTLEENYQRLNVTKEGVCYSKMIGVNSWYAFLHPNDSVPGLIKYVKNFLNKPNFQGETCNVYIHLDNEIHKYVHKAPTNRVGTILDRREVSANKVVYIRIEVLHQVCSI